jgi:hypothetical protein
MFFTWLVSSRGGPDGEKERNKEEHRNPEKSRAGAHGGRTRTEEGERGVLWSSSTKGQRKEMNKEKFKRKW